MDTKPNGLSNQAPKRLPSVTLELECGGKPPSVMENLSLKKSESETDTTAVVRELQEPRSLLMVSSAELSHLPKRAPGLK